MGGHVFLDYMFFRMTYDSICLEGGHAFVVGNLLWAIKYKWNACLQDGISYNLFCIFLKDMSYWRSCFTWGYYRLIFVVFLVDHFFG